MDAHAIQIRLVRIANPVVGVAPQPLHDWEHQQVPLSDPVYLRIVAERVENVEEMLDRRAILPIEEFPRLPPNNEATRRHGVRATLRAAADRHHPTQDAPAPLRALGGRQYSAGRSALRGRRARGGPATRSTRPCETRVDGAPRPRSPHKQ